MPLILLFIQYSFNAQHVSAVNTTIFRSLRLIGCYFMGSIWYGVCWRSVSVWLWRCGVFMQSEALLLKMVVLTAETCWALNEYWINNKISGIKLVFLFTQPYFKFCPKFLFTENKPKLNLSRLFLVYTCNELHQNHSVVAEMLHVEDCETPQNHTSYAKVQAEVKVCALLSATADGDAKHS